MDASTHGAAASLLGRFSDEMTLVVDRWFGTDWAENDEILAILELNRPKPRTTREVAVASGMHRRALSRLVARLRAAGYVTTERSTQDGRTVVVHVTALGSDRFTTMAADLDAFFDSAHDDAAQIARLLGCADARALRPRSAGPTGLLEEVVTVGQELGALVDPRATVSRLSGRKLSALVQVAGGDRVRPSTLSPSLRVTRAGVAYVVDDLCAQGLIRRRHGAAGEDGRAVLLEATESGRQALEPLREAVAATRHRLGALFVAVRDRVDCHLERV